MKNYIINNNTLAIIPINGKCEVIEKFQTLYLNISTYELISANCLYYGSSLKGRIDSANYYLGSKYKCPILISEKNKIIMFPTSSSNNDNCIWFNYEGIKEYKVNDNNILVTLTNGKNINVKISKNSFSSQIFKSSRLESIINHKNQ